MILVDKLAMLLGSKGWLTDASDTTKYSRDWLNKYGVPPIGVARPASTMETSEVLRLCYETNTPIVPQGGITGLVGASVACAPGTIILSLERMNNIESIDEQNFTTTIGAGVVLEQLHNTLAEKDLMFPLHLGSQGSAQIGGLIATNAGGSHAFRFGTMQDLVLGLEVVLPTGEIWDGTRHLLKDNTGFQLRKLFCGSEGRLGVITRAVLKTYPTHKSQATALIALPNLKSALQFGRVVRNSISEFLTALEFFDDNILELTLKNVSETKWPMDSRSPIYLLVELSCSLKNFELSEFFENFLEDAFKSELITDAVLSQSEEQRLSIWKIRENLPEATLREGPQLKHDISVPVTEIPSFLQDCSTKIKSILPNVRIWSFGHLGDGNIHYNLSPPIGQNDFGSHSDIISYIIYKTAEQHGGSFAAEHGIGRSKKLIADELRSPVERNLMRKIHESIDPKNIMNPGVII